MNLVAEKDAQNSCLFDCSELRRAKVMLIGAGGLGCAIAVHLAGAGVGEIYICDFDAVSLSNLNRQFVYTVEDIAKSKALTASKFLSAYAPDCRVFPVCEKLNCSNAAELLAGFDLVITACDNVETRLAANKACTVLCVPLLDSGISGGFGRVYLYIPGETACLNCVIGGESCDKRTVGAAAGIVGGAAAMQALRFLSGKEHGNAGKLYAIDCINSEENILTIKKSQNCTICGGENNG